MLGSIYHSALTGCILEDKWVAGAHSSVRISVLAPARVTNPCNPSPSSVLPRCVSGLSKNAPASHIPDTDVDKLVWRQIAAEWSSAPLLTGTSKRAGVRARVGLWCGVLKSGPGCLTWQWIWCKLQPGAGGREVRWIVMWDNRVNSKCWSLLPLWPTFPLRW